MNIKRELNYKLFLQREENTRHLDFDKEFGFYTAIANGDIEDVKRRHRNYIESNRYTTSQEKNGVLSKNPVQNSKFHFVILAAMITRFCVEAGLDREEAYNMSDIYIQKADECTTLSQIDELQAEMIFFYTNRMKTAKNKSSYSKHVSKCIDYIYDNLNKKISVEGIADYLKISPSYLSKLFAKEVGDSLSNYIRLRKLEAAANMLQYTDYEISEISEYFNFSSQSHFTTLFQNKYKMTPKKFRDSHNNKSITKILSEQD